MKRGVLWKRLNSPAAAIISSLRTMTKLVPDIKLDNGGQTPTGYLFSHLMTLEVAFRSPYVSCSLCRTLAACSKALGVHLRRDRDMDVGLCEFIPFSGICHGSNHCSGPQLLLSPMVVLIAGDTGSSIGTLPVMCIHRGPTSLVWLLGGITVPVTAKIIKS